MLSSGRPVRSLSIGVHLSVRSSASASVKLESSQPTTTSTNTIKSRIKSARAKDSCNNNIGRLPQQIPSDSLVAVVGVDDRLVGSRLEFHLDSTSRCVNTQINQVGP